MSDQRLCQAPNCDNPLADGDNSTACPRCWDRHARRITSIPALVDELETTLSRQTSTGQTGTTGTSEVPLAYSVAASDAMRLLHQTLWGWAREGLNTHPDLKAATPLRRTLTDHGAAIVDMASLLHQLQPWLITHPQGHEAIEEINYATRQAVAAIDRHPERQYAGTCECGVELYAHADQATITCDCGQTRDIHAWRTERMVDASDQLLTLTEMTWAIATTTDQTISRKRLEGWVRHGWLLRSGNIGAVPTYRVGDVLDLIMRRAT